MNTHTTQSRISTKTKQGATISKRSKAGAWRYVTRAGGKDYYFPLGYSENEAKELADKVRATILLEGIDTAREKFCQKALLRDKPPSPTIDQVLTTLDQIQHVMGWATVTKNGYKNSLVSIARTALNKSTEEVKAMECSIFNPSLISKYKDAKLFGVDNEARKKSVMRTINRNIRELKAVFGSNTEQYFSKYDMSFVGALKTEKFYRGLRKLYRLPKGQMVSDTFALADSLSGDQGTALNLALYFGLRRGEIYHARRDWFDLEGDLCRIDIGAERDFRPKGGHEGITMGSKAAAVAILNKASGDDYLLGRRVKGGRSLFQELVKVLRGIGYTMENGREKPLHEMRKLFGSYVATSQSIYTAQKYLRHADSSTTNESYADIIVDKKVLKLWAA
ncbi:MAG: hypothetical protein CL532_01680 [Aestuariivita sp.]|nr:hypothetical protein [Aestuariivita sp.]|tara:strand:- start:4282 stop:5457 length:1176 start_codon:yes stop_codon:yes gene_type:complete